MADFKMAVATRQQTPGADGNLDFTISGFGTPKGAIVYMMLAGNDAAQRDGDLAFSVGFTDGTNSRCAAVASEHGVATSDTYRGTLTYLAAQINNAGTIVKNVVFNSWITDGVRLTFDVDATAACDVIVVLIGGEDASVAVGTFTPNSTQNGTATVNSLGFDPNALLFVGCGDTSFGTSSNSNAILSYGAAVAGIAQRCAFWSAVDGGGSSVINNRVETNSCMGQVFSNALSWTGEVTAFVTGGFTVTTRDGGSGSDVVGYMAISTGGAGVSLQTLDTATSTGTKSYTTGFTPQCILGAMTSADAVDTTESTLDDAEGFSVFAADATNEYAFEFAQADEVATTRVMQRKDSKAVCIGYDNVGTFTSLAAASLDSFGATAVVLDYTTVDAAARYGWLLAVEEGDAGGGGETTILPFVNQIMMAG